METNIDYRNLFLGIDTLVELNDRREKKFINFDNAATTPPFKCVNDSIMDSMLMYGSIGRGKGQKSFYSTDIYEKSRDIILRFFNIDNKDYSIIYVKNTTEGINVLANALIKSKNDKVLLTRMEHHANDLPWRNIASPIYIEVDKDGKIDIKEIEEAFVKHRGEIKYISLTGASNVTGYTNDINKVASIAHKYGAKIIVDAAQLIAHKQININGSTQEESIDYLVFSGHKMYAPFGSGVIVARKDEIEKSRPFLNGGGMVELVLDYNEYLDGVPGRFEAGTPNFFGVIGIASAIKKLNEIGFSNIEKHEDDLKNYFFNEMNKISNVILYGDENEKNRLGIICFNIKNLSCSQVAEILAKSHGIGVRDGGFCAHPYVRRLLQIDDRLAYMNKVKGEKNIGMIRASLGMYNTVDEINEFLNALEYISIKNKKI